MISRTGVIATVLAAAVAATPLASTSVAGTATDGDRDPFLRRKLVDDKLTGAAFGIAADLDGKGGKELLVTSFGKLNGTAVVHGSVVSYRRTAKGAWRKRTIIPTSAEIRFPNEPLVDDVDGDGDQDVLVPGGFFICAATAEPNCGSLTWWEQRPRMRPSKRWKQHNIVAPGATRFYHRILLHDLDGDGLRDLITVGETPGDAQVEVFAGTDDADRFATTPTTLAQGGGSLPILHDADADGDLDIVSGQYFDRSASFVWFEQTVPASPVARFGGWTRHNMVVGLGGVIQVAHVPGLGLVGSNHTNTTSGPPGTAESGMYLLEPGADPRAPWNATLLSEGIVSRPDTAAGQQQGAPGVFDFGDLDSDGDIDLAISGDGDPRLIWLERTGPKTFTTRVIKSGFGQSGGGAILDTDRDGRMEAFFSSYDDSSVNLFEIRRRR
jgi:hypothetical protein